MKSLLLILVLNIVGITNQVCDSEVFWWGDMVVQYEVEDVMGSDIQPLACEQQDMKIWFWF